MVLCLRTWCVLPAIKLVTEILIINFSIPQKISHGTGWATASSSSTSASVRPPSYLPTHISRLILDVRLDRDRLVPDPAPPRERGARPR
jgi:hypothetical protein